MKNKNNLYINIMSIVLFILVAIMEKSISMGWISFMLFQIITRILLLIVPFIWILIFAIVVVTIYILCNVIYLVISLLMKGVKFINGRKNKKDENGIEKDDSQKFSNKDSDNYRSPNHF